MLSRRAFLFGAIILWNVGCSPTLRISLLDIGEGDATLLRFPSGEKVLIDAGNVPAGVQVVKLLKERGVSELDALLLTHPHPDHFGGVFVVLESLPVKRVYDNGDNLESVAKSEDLFRWYVDEVRTKHGGKALRAGDRFDFERGSIAVLSPQDVTATQDWNTNSLVLIASCDAARALFMGDANEATEKQLLGNGADLSAIVLKVGHHGAADASTQPFLERVRPRVALVSVNSDNIRGYPDRKVMERLEAVADEVYVTAQDGTVELALDCTTGTVARSGR